MHAVTASGLGKQYKLGERESYRALRDVVAGWGRRVLGRGGDAGRAKRGRETIWSLRDLSFEIDHGDTLGIVGRNGAGKSTLLKILARITRPTRGSVVLNGNVGSLLEVGTGFHPELTGRDNVFLSGAILGMTRAEIKRKFDEIIAFAEIEKFVDTPVKRYSSGMYMRLAFAVAAHLEPEILLVDEVLAVGDVAFQKKCLGKMGEVAKEGRTILFVSHNMGAVTALCRRAFWIHDGEMKADGPSQKVVSQYLQAVRSGTLVMTAKKGEELVFEQVTLRNGRGEVTHEFYPRDDLQVEIDYYAPTALVRPNLWVVLLNGRGQGVCCATMLFDGHNPDRLEGRGKVVCTFKSLPLTPQPYTVLMGARASDGSRLITESKEVAYFTVGGQLADYGLGAPSADVFVEDFPWPVLPYSWDFPGSGRAAANVELKRRG